MNSAISIAAQPRRVLWDSVARGGLGLAAGFAAIGVEILRNYTYGLGEVAVVAFTFALFAVALGVIPANATAQRWTPALIVLLTICFAVTGYCGMQYYAAKLNAAERHSRPPFGLTSKNMPRPSASLYAVSAGFAFFT